MVGIGRDVAYALRLLRRSPGFTLAAVVTLALGIGANAAVFSLAEATLLRPIKVANPSELFAIRWSSSYPDYLAYSDRHDLFNGVIASSGGRVNVAANGSADLVEASFVSGNYFGVLGIAPAAGRLMTPADDSRTGPVVAVLGHRWWRTRFGSDPAIVGTTLRVNSVAVTIIGIAAEGFRGTSLSEPANLFLPLTAAPKVRTGFFARRDMLDSRGMSWLNVTARLRTGITAQAAAGSLDVLFRQFHKSSGAGRPEQMELVSLKTQALGGSSDQSVVRFVMLLVAVVTLTLLIGCANLANLLLSRGATRQNEMGVRMAIGAGRNRIVRQLLVESIVLAIAGAGAGLLVASVGLRLLARFQLPGGIEIEALGLGLSRGALLYTAIVASVTGIVFGLAPAWRAAHTDLVGSLRDDTRSISARSGLRSTLVAAQVALSLVLLAGTGLFLQSLVHSLRVPLGFTVEGVATASVNLGTARYDARAKVFYDDAIVRVHRLPGVTAASWSSLVPTNGAHVFTASVDGYTARPDQEVFFYTSTVGPEYFQAAGTRLVRGRVFSNLDSAATPGVAIVNETAARRYWPDRDALGGRIDLDHNDSVQVVGIVEDTKVHELDEEPTPYLYMAFAQRNSDGPVDAAHLLVRTNGDVEAILGPIDALLRSLDTDAPVYFVSPFAWRVRQLVMPQRMGVMLFAAFSALGLTLAAIGIYGVAAYIATLRTREIGIRIALGADRAQIRALVLREGARPVIAGLVAGLVVAALGGQLATAFLRGVTPHDPVTYATVAVLLSAIAMGATWIPARRAAKLEPMSALREQ
jgi:predicted permease